MRFPSIWDRLVSDPGSPARTGMLRLPHGVVPTPAFMPVGTAATVKAMHHETIENLGYRLILANTYHLFLRPGLEVISAAGGLHGFSTWPYNILTDSGGFQVFSLSGLRKIGEKGVEFRSHLDGSRHLFTPESVVDAQVTFNSDVQMALDVCTAPGISMLEAREAMELTTRWAQRAKRRFLEHRDRGYLGSLFPIVQGNFFGSLRTEHAETIGSLELPGVAIGGLSVGESPADFREYLSLTAQALPQEVPRYLMGVGTPDYILEAIEAGIDMVDCVFPTRIARNGTALTADGRVVLRNEAHATDHAPIEAGCGCHACRRYSRSYLRHLVKSDEILASMLITEHNLYYLSKLVGDARDAIGNGVFASFKKNVLSRIESGEQVRLDRR
ncbi:MAG: tRNA guanosine(34) transglycosylase Tgt [Spirochaetales bacterium]